MKFFNRAGNRVFGIVFSYLLNQRFKDTLCGTKVLWRKDWLRIEKDSEVGAFEISGAITS